MPAIGPSDIREANALSCLQSLRVADRPLSVSDIAQRTGLSRPTIEAVLTDFAARELVDEAAVEGAGSAGGRPARRFRFAAESGLVAGLDAGPRDARVIVADLTGRIVAERATRLDPLAPGDDRFALISDLLCEAIDSTGLPRERLRALGVGVSGIVDADGAIAQSTVVPSWSGRPIAAQLSERFGCLTAAENDVKLRAFAEHHFGAAQDATSIVFLHVGTWVTIALTLESEIFHGAHRSAGEVGSRRGMRWSSHAEGTEPLWSTGDGSERIAAAAAGDPEAREEVRTFVRDIAPTLATVALTMDPDMVVVGGLLAERGGLAADWFREELDGLVTLDTDFPVAASPLGARGIVLGALATAFVEGSEALFGIPGAPIPAIPTTEAAE
jgi:predicted NBD/HSP70 family sugar kinase